MSGYLLIVEQDSWMRTCLQENLRNVRLETVAVASGDECLRLSFSNNRPSLIILGWQMPVLTGLEILTLLKLNERSKSIPVIMVGEEQDCEVHALKAGAYTFITYPLDLNALVSHIQKALGLV